MSRIVNAGGPNPCANDMRLGYPHETMSGYESGPESAVTDRGPADWIGVDQ